MICTKLTTYQPCKNSNGLFSDHRILYVDQQQGGPEGQRQMEVTYNDITDIKVQSEDRDFYKITYVTATDSEGRQFTIRMFGHDNNQTKVEVE